MDDTTSDAVTRRASLLSLGTGGLMAVLAGPISTPAKNNAKKKLKKKQQQKCQNQEEQCTTTIAAICEEDSENPDELQQCLDDFLPCCEFLARCDAEAYLNCVD